jgi:MerT mercuric transport protein
MTDKTAKIATGSAFGLGALASAIGLCCVGPWAVSLLGVSGAIAIAEYEPYRMYILTLAGIFLAWGFWHVYQLPKQCTTDACQQSARKGVKAMLWLSSILVIVAFFMDDITNHLISPLS